MEPDSRTCLYDADCGICTWCVRLGQRWDRHQRIAFLPSSDVEHRPAGVSDELLRETIVVIHGPDYAVRARAVASLLEVLPFGRPLSWFLRMPGLSWLFDRAYRMVSANRTRISMRLGLAACEVPRSHAER